MHGVQAQCAAQGLPVSQPAQRRGGVAPHCAVQQGRSALRSRLGAVGRPADDWGLWGWDTDTKT